MLRPTVLTVTFSIVIRVLLLSLAAVGPALAQSTPAASTAQVKVFNHSVQPVYIKVLQWNDGSKSHGPTVTERVLPGKGMMLRDDSPGAPVIEATWIVYCLSIVGKSDLGQVAYQTEYQGNDRFLWIDIEAADLPPLDTDGAVGHSGKMLLSGGPITVANDTNERVQIVLQSRVRPGDGTIETMAGSYNIAPRERLLLTYDDYRTAILARKLTFHVKTDRGTAGPFEYDWNKRSDKKLVEMCCNVSQSELPSAPPVVVPSPPIAELPARQPDPEPRPAAKTYRVGDAVRNKGFLWRWNGTIVGIDGDRYQIRINYAANERDWIPRKTYDFVSGEFK